MPDALISILTVINGGSVVLAKLNDVIIQTISDSEPGMLGVERALYTLSKPNREILLSGVTAFDKSIVSVTRTTP